MGTFCLLYFCLLLLLPGASSSAAIDSLLPIALYFSSNTSTTRLAFPREYSKWQTGVISGVAALTGEQTESFLVEGYSLERHPSRGTELVRIHMTVLLSQCQLTEREITRILEERAHNSTHAPCDDQPLCSLVDVLVLEESYGCNPTPTTSSNGLNSSQLWLALGIVVGIGSSVLCLTVAAQRLRSSREGVGMCSWCEWGEPYLEEGESPAHRTHVNFPKRWRESPEKKMSKNSRKRLILSSPTLSQATATTTTTCGGMGLGIGVYSSMSRSYSLPLTHRSPETKEHSEAGLVSTRRKQHPPSLNADLFVPPSVAYQAAAGGVNMQLRTTINNDGQTSAFHPAYTVQGQTLKERRSPTNPHLSRLQLSTQPNSRERSSSSSIETPSLSVEVRVRCSPQTPRTPRTPHGKQVLCYSEMVSVVTPHYSAHSGRPSRGRRRRESVVKTGAGNDPPLTAPARPPSPGFAAHMNRLRRAFSNSELMHSRFGSMRSRNLLLQSSGSKSSHRRAATMGFLPPQQDEEGESDGCNTIFN